MVQQKQAHIDFLATQLQEAKAKTPDELTKALDMRVTALLAELARMQDDKATTQAELDKIAKRLEYASARLRGRK